MTPLGEEGGERAPEPVGIHEPSSLPPVGDHAGGDDGVAAAYFNLHRRDADTLLC
jgi:hypothetical protein